MLNAAKTSSIFIIFGLSVTSGTLSLVTVKCLLNKFGVSDRFKRVISVLNCFSGGVFFATSVIDLLPEARESMEQAKTHYGYEIDYPFTEVLACTGFFFILTMEHLAHYCCSPSSTGAVSSLVTTSPANHSSPDQSASSAPEDSNKFDSTRAIEHPILMRHDFEDSSYADDLTYQTYGAVDASFDKTSIKPYAGILSREGTPRDTTVLFGNSDKIVIRNNPSKIGQEPKLSLADAFDEPVEEMAISKLRGIILLIALSLHMVFDGLALGLMEKESKTWQLLAALSLHKVLVFMTIGLQALEILRSVKKAILVLIVLALVSPCGILIGDSIISSGDEMSRDTVSAILQGLATGTFLFVTFFEILQRELGHEHHDILKVIVTVLGFVLVALVRVLDGDDGE